MFNLSHLTELNQSYVKHGANALSNLPKALVVTAISALMIPVIIIHTIFPFIFNNPMIKGTATIPIIIR